MSRGRLPPTARPSCYFDKQLILLCQETVS
jgi:hypothetical protein